MIATDAKVATDTCGATHPYAPYGECTKPATHTADPLSHHANRQYGWPQVVCLDCHAEKVAP